VGSYRWPHLAIMIGSIGGFILSGVPDDMVTLLRKDPMNNCHRNYYKKK